MFETVAWSRPPATSPAPEIDAFLATKTDVPRRYIKSVVSKRHIAGDHGGRRVCPRRRAPSVAQAVGMNVSACARRVCGYVIGVAAAPSAAIRRGPRSFQWGASPECARGHPEPFDGDVEDRRAIAGRLASAVDASHPRCEAILRLDAVALRGRERGAEAPELRV